MQHLPDDRSPSLWAQKTNEEILADLKAVVVAATDGLGGFIQHMASCMTHENLQLRAYMEAPPWLPEPKTAEVRRQAAQARAVAVLGPKHGRWA